MGVRRAPRVARQHDVDRIGTIHRSQPHADIQVAQAARCATERPQVRAFVPCRAEDKKDKIDGLPVLGAKIDGGFKACENPERLL